MPEDSYGSYKVLTGSEGTGKCWWCGKPFPDNRARRFCSLPCRSKYQNNFYWTWAANNALRRARYRCHECGIKGKRRLHVHHIVPLKGSDRMVNLLNKPDNLVVLCKKCHRKYHINLNNSKINTK